MVTRQDVVHFLRLFKGSVMLERLRVKDREKNRQALIKLGITADQRREILLGVMPDNYVAGPKPDDTDDTKEVWVFGREVQDTEVYIKLRVAQDPRRKSVWYAMVRSFHPAEHTMKYPLRGGRS